MRVDHYGIAVFQQREDGSRNRNMLCYSHPLTLKTTLEELARIDEMGGAVAAIDYMKARLVESNTARLGGIESGDTIVVGALYDVKSGGIEFLADCETTDSRVA